MLYTASEKMANVNSSNYYNIIPGTNFKKILTHFREQAEGKPSKYVKMPGQNFRMQSGYRYISMSDNNHDNDMPKMTVTDPNEAVHKRAASQLKQDLGDKTEEMPTPIQSASRPRKRKIYSKQNSSAITASKVIKRARDLFDN